MSMPPSYTEDFEINNASSGRPHVVILGAGASYAAFPRGDKNGKKLPLLKDFVSTIGLEAEMQEAGVIEPYDDFESIYSEIATTSNNESVKERLDTKIYKYFEKLELPDEPTLYDHLILSLRSKDVIATFNWDPFLWNAWHRNKDVGSSPSILFLHGSVATGRCDDCTLVASRSSVCPKCGKSLSEIPILYPVTEKDYNSDPAIAAHWRNLKRALKQAYALTVFGYSAPKTDVEAIELLKDGWGTPESRELEEIEIIDIQNEDKLTDSWEPFIHSHHYTIRKSFYESYIAQHPRRSCEALWSQLMECMFLDSFTIPRTLDFQQLHEWLQPRINNEKKG
jgi:hypothetical protein